MVAALSAVRGDRRDVVGLEPSCLLSLRDEFLVMGLVTRASATVAERALMIEEFLAREQRNGRLSLPLRRCRRSAALVHGHCHQKAFDALNPAVAVLD